VVTVTLPKETLRALETIDHDRARAIVRATERALAAAAPEAGPAVDLLPVSDAAAVIAVPFVPALAGIPGIELIRILPRRYLVVLEPGRPLAELELALGDAIEALPAAEGPGQDRAVLEGLLGQLRDLRRGQRARTGTLILVDL
jgi:hypothetical protein